MESFEVFYGSAAQHPWLLWLAAAIGLGVALSRSPLDAGLRSYCIALALLSAVDAWLTSPRIYGVESFSGFAASAVPLFFVLAGDFRFLLLVCAGTSSGGIVPTRQSVMAAAAISAIVPIFAQIAVSVIPGASENPRVLFLVYELAFVALTLVLLRSFDDLRDKPWLRSVCRFVLLYYGLWATADAVILATGSDLGFGLRVVPNVLYYGGLIGAIGWAGSRAPRAAATGGGRELGRD